MSTRSTAFPVQLSSVPPEPFGTPVPSPVTVKAPSVPVFTTWMPAGAPSHETLSNVMPLVPIVPPTTTGVPVVVVTVLPAPVTLTWTVPAVTSPSADVAAMSMPWKVTTAVPPATLTPTIAAFVTVVPPLTVTEPVML